MDTFIRQLSWMNMVIYMIAAIIPYCGSGLFLFCIMADYRKWLREELKEK